MPEMSQQELRSNDSPNGEAAATIELNLFYSLPSQHQMTVLISGLVFLQYTIFDFNAELMLLSQ